MATKNVPAKAKKPSTAVASYEDRLAAMAKQSTEQEASVSAGNFISVKGGRLSYQGNTMKDGTLNVVVVDSILENVFYADKFDPDNPVPPTCYALGRDDKNMAPHAQVKDPQNGQCHDCPQNKFGTADNGKGKACKNIRRLALLAAAPLDEETLKAGDVAYMRIPVTSVKGWASYVRSLKALENKPPLAFVTQVEVVGDDKTQFKIQFHKEADLEPEQLEIVMERYDDIAANIDFPYPEPSAEAAKPAGKKVAKRKY